MMNVMKWVGLTGDIASGKSTVSRILREQGVPVVDADQLAHQGLVDLKEQILQAFGPDVLVNNVIDRAKLGALVFGQPEKKAKLESILHPYVQSAVKAWRLQQEATGRSFAVYDVPLLFEKKLQDQFDFILYVDAPAPQIIERLKLRNGWTEKQAQHRRSQLLDPEYKKKYANLILNNDSDLENLKRQVQNWLSSFTKV